MKRTLAEAACSCISLSPPSDPSSHCHCCSKPYCSAGMECKIDVHLRDWRVWFFYINDGSGDVINTLCVCVCE